MATIGLDKLYAAPITDGEGGEEYGTPKQIAKAISVSLSVEVAEATLYADDSASEIVKEFSSGTISLNVDDLDAEALQLLAGARKDENGVLVQSGEDVTPAVALGFRAKKANGKYRYFWLYRVKFGIPGIELSTKADSITFSTPTIEGTISCRNKEDGKEKHPWKAEVTEGDVGADTAIATWYTTVYEPSYGE